MTVIDFFQKFKKTHGPDFEDPSVLRRLPSKESTKDEEESFCDICKFSSTSNKDGHPEAILTCKDCNSKGLVMLLPTLFYRFIHYHCCLIL